MTQLQILIVEDELIVAADLKLTLTNLGYNVIEITDSGEHAIEIAESKHPDLILMDIKLAGKIDGITTAERIHAFSDIPVIYVSAYANHTLLQRVKRTSPFGYLIKPFNERELNVTIEVAMYKHALDRKLKESEERFRNVVEDQTEFICRFLPDSTHIFVNDAYCRYFDRDQKNLIGHMFRPKLHPEDQEIVAQHIASLTPQHPVKNIDQRIILPDGSIRWQRWSDRALFDKKGRVIEYQSVGRDITEQKEAEEALRKVSRKLALLSSITRDEINNQLTVLLGFLHILEKKQPTLSSSEYFQKTGTAAKRISDMIRFSNEYEKIGIEAPLWYDIHKLVSKAAKQAPLGQVEVKIGLPAGMEVFADPLIIKVCYNLIDNAVRYGGKITTIWFSVQESGDEQVLICEDDGDGVPADVKEKIFNRGFGRNTGLGLFLSREILSITGITIKETGKPGKGARFEMTVPKGMWRITQSDKKGK